MSFIFLVSNENRTLLEGTSDLMLLDTEDIYAEDPLVPSTTVWMSLH